MSPRGFLPIALAGLSVPALASDVTSKTEKPTFNADIRPILSDNCFHCHGPDPNTREAGLRLDVRDAAITPLESGKSAIVPSHPEQSELITRISHDDSRDLMPPPKSHKTLTAAQKKTLGLWIKQGATYEPHWAFQPIVNPEIPPVDASSVPDHFSPRHAIDRFVLAKLSGSGLQPQPEASRAGAPSSSLAGPHRSPPDFEAGGSLHQRSPRHRRCL